MVKYWAQLVIRRHFPIDSVSMENIATIFPIQNPSISRVYSFWHLDLYKPIHNVLIVLNVHQISFFLKKGERSLVKMVSVWICLSHVYYTIFTSSVWYSFRYIVHNRMLRSEFSRIIHPTECSFLCADKTMMPLLYLFCYAFYDRIAYSVSGIHNMKRYKSHVILLLLLLPYVRSFRSLVRTTVFQPEIKYSNEIVIRLFFHHAIKTTHWINAKWFRSFIS